MNIELSFATRHARLRRLMRLRSRPVLALGMRRYCFGEPVWPSGKARAGKQKDLGSNPLRFSFLFKSCGLWTLFFDFVPHN